MLSLDPEKQQYQQKNHHKDQQRRCGQAGIIDVLEVVVHEMLEHIDALVGTVSPQQERLPEGFEGIDHRNDEYKEEVGDHQGQGNAPEDMAGRGAVAPGGVGVVRRNGA